MREKTTVAVIGGGPGGYVAAIRAAQLGADVTLIEKEQFTAMQRRKAAVVRKLFGGVQGLLRANGVKVIIGTAQFLDSKKLIVNVKDGELILTFDRIIIASGSVPAVPPIPGIDCPQCIDSTGA